MKISQYRLFIAYYREWYPILSFKDALVDIGITDSEENVKDELFGCGWIFDGDGYLHWEEEYYEQQ